ncbi:MAG TPA: hypothetical protein VM029_08695 [Opitutaceae bacterium]|nr:hypothetical protein [Opitutaceae bacterium]
MSDPAPNARHPLPPATPPAVDPVPGPNVTEAHTPAPVPAPLTPEEQMEKFAQDLKENDWGHQPC